METLKSTDKFRQLLKKFNHAKPSANVKLNHDTSVRKSNREIKKPVKYDADPTVGVATAKEPKHKAKSFQHLNKSTERRDKSGERGDRCGRMTGTNPAAPLVSGTIQQDLPHDHNNKSAEHRDKSGERGSGRRKDKSNERITGTDPDAPLVSGTIQQNLRNEGVSCGPSSPVRSAFTRVLANANKDSTMTRRTLQEPVSQSQHSGRSVDSARCEQLTMRQQDHEGGYMPERRRQRDFESSYIPGRRRHQSYEPENRLADMYSERARDVFARPRQVSSNQSRWHPRASQTYDIHGTINQPVVRLDDMMRAREHSALYRSRMPPPEIRQPSVKVFDIMNSQERDAWQHSRMAQPPPDRPKHYDDGFLRPITPPSTAELARKEESTFLHALSEFKNCSLFSTVEVIFLLNHLEDSLIHKISKTIRKSDTAQSVLRTTMMETVPEDSSRSYMVRSWLKSNDSVAPQRPVDGTDVHSKRIREPTDYEYAKRMRGPAGEDGLYYQPPREPRHHDLSSYPY